MNAMTLDELKTNPDPNVEEVVQRIAGKLRKFPVDEQLLWEKMIDLLLKFRAKQAATDKSRASK